MADYPTRSSGTTWTPWQIQTMELAVYAIRSQSIQLGQHTPTEQDLAELLQLALNASKDRETQ